MTIIAPIVFLIPSYRPTNVLGELVEQLREADSAPIVVVDDGSGPAYSEIFERVCRVAGTTLLINAVNLGKGAALKHGMNHILVKHPDSVGVVTVDGDGQHAAADILRVATQFKQSPGKLIFGARSFDAKVPRRSRFGNIVSRYIYRFLIGLNLSDTQTGLRAIPKRLMGPCLGIRANHYEFETEQLVLVRAIGIPVEEVPIRTIYIEGNRASHFRPLLDSARIYFVLLRYSIASIVTEMADLAVFTTAMAWSDNLLFANAAGRLIALWVQFALLKNFVFRSPGSLKILASYLGLVVFSGVISTALQVQFANLIPFPVVAKVLAEILVFLFNFLFLRDFIFMNSTDATRD